MPKQTWITYAKKKMQKFKFCKKEWILLSNNFLMLKRYVMCDLANILNLTTIRDQNQGLVDETTNAQIDIFILDSRKKLNQIIGAFSPFCPVIIDFNL
jgi:hypothetical protein